MSEGDRSGRALQPAQAGWWIDNGLRPILIAAMLASLGALLARLLQTLMPGWRGVYFPLFAFLACLEGVASERVLRRRRITGWDYVLSRAAELLLLLILLRLAGYLAAGGGPLWADVRRWLAAPGEFLALDYLLLAPLLAVLWLVSLQVAQLLLLLDEEAGRGPPPADTTSAAYYLWLTQPPAGSDREAALAQLGGVFVLGGILALLVAGVAQHLGPEAGGVALPTLLYFALGLALLTQARFSVARAGWQIQGVLVQPTVGRRWLLWATLFLIGIAGSAVLLPADYAQGVIGFLVAVLWIALRALAYVGMLIVFLLSIPLLLVFPRMRPMQRPVAPDLTLPGPEPQMAAAPSPWLRTAGLALFWLLVTVVVVYAGYRFYEDRLRAGAGGQRVGQARLTWWRRFVAWLLSLGGQWGPWRRSMLARLTARQATDQPPTVSSARFLSLRRLAPAERIRFFYLSAARRAAQAGRPRESGETPYEYQSSLDEHLPGLEPDLTGLTEAFVGARYSSRAVKAEEAEAVKPLWQRIQAILRRRRARQDG